MRDQLITTLEKIPLPLLLAASIFLGLAPFTPRPHLVEKLEMLVQGNLVQAIDIFDLALHGAPIILLVLKLVLRRRTTTGK